MLKKSAVIFLTISLLLTAFSFHGLAAENPLLVALNGANTAEDVATVISTNKDAFILAGVDFMIYDALPGTSKTAVHTAFIEKDYATDGETSLFVTDLEKAIADVVIYKFVPFMEDMNCINDTSNINSKGNWTKSILYKVDTNVEHYRSEALLKVALVVRKSNNSDNSKNTTGTVTIYETDKQWAQYIDNLDTLAEGDQANLPTALNASKIDEYESTRLTGPDTIEAYDITNFIKNKVQLQAPPSFVSLLVHNLPDGFYLTTEENSIPDIGIYSFYDKASLLQSFNDATNATLGQLIEKSGSVIGIDSLEFKNMHERSRETIISDLASVVTFGSLGDVKNAYETSREKSLHKVRYEITENNNVTTTPESVTRAPHTVDSKWINPDSDDAFEMVFDLSSAPTEYVASKNIYLRTRQAADSGVDAFGVHLRDISMLPVENDYKAREFPYLSSELLPPANGQYNGLSITDSKFDNDGKLRILANSFINKVYGITTSNIMISPTVEGNTKWPYIEVRYDKNAIIQALSESNSIEELTEILKNYGTFLGINASELANNLNKMALALYNQRPIEGITAFETIMQDYANISAGALLPILNEIDTAEAMVSLITNFADVLEVDAETFNKLLYKDTIASNLVNNKGGGYETLFAFRTAFNAEMDAWVKSIHSLAFVDYNYGDKGDDHINTSTKDWHKNILTQYYVSNDINTESDSLVSVTYTHQQGKRGTSAQGALVNKGVHLYEISPTGWEDTTPTPHTKVNELGIVTDVSRPVKESIVNVEDGGIVSIDVSDYFINQGCFAKNQNETFALRFGIAGTSGNSSFFVSSGGAGSQDTDLKLAPRLILRYDLGRVLYAVNTADKDTIGEILSKHGSVIGINVEAYNNLKFKKDVHLAVLNKDFQTPQQLVDVVNSAIESYLFYETVSITDAAKWGHKDLSGTTSGVGAVDLYLSKRRDIATFLEYPTGTFDKEYVAHVEASVARRSGGEGEPSKRQVLFGETVDIKSTAYYSSNSNWASEPIKAEVTDIYKKTDDAFTVYLRGDISNIYYYDANNDRKLGAGEMVSTPIYKATPPNPTRFTLKIGYDRLKVAYELGRMSVDDAATELATLYPVLGIAEDDNYRDYAIALHGENIDTIERLNHVLANVKSGGVHISSLTTENGNDFTVSAIWGIVSVKNMSDSPAPLAVVVATFDENDELLNVCLPPVASGTIAAHQGTDLSFNLPGSETATKLKAFIWDSLTNLEPYDLPMILPN